MAREDIYTQENYSAYCAWIEEEHPDGGIVPGSFEEWVAFNKTMDKLNAEPIDPSTIPQRIFDLGQQIVDNDQNSSK